MRAINETVTKGFLTQKEVTYHVQIIVNDEMKRIGF
jgi:hypothetical protein